MNRRALIERVAAEAELPRPAAARALDAALAAIESSLRAGEPVKLAGFGCFHVGSYTGRPGVNPRTGERIVVASTPVPRFRPGSRLRAAAASAPFGARLADAVARRESQIVLGIDPDPGRLWPAAVAAAGDGAAPPPARAARAVVEHCRLLIAAAAPACVAAKLQLACFERLGAPGWAALADVAALARDAGLLVIADGKRGDVPVTAAAYAQALAGSTPTLAGSVAGLGADAFTANPLLGVDALEPLIATGAGVFVLVRTSNAGASDVMDLALADGEPLWQRLARIVDRLGRGDGALADIGAVVGATAPEHLVRARELMPRTIFLIPGVGAQEGRVEDLGPAFAAGRAGAIVSASRSIAHAHERRGGEPAAAARAEAERLREAAWSLGG